MQKACAPISVHTPYATGYPPAVLGHRQTILKKVKLSIQTERHHRIAICGFVFTSTAAHDRHVLHPIDLVDARRGVGRGRQFMLPKNLARFLIEGADFFVSGSCNKHNASCGGDRAPKIL